MSPKVGQQVDQRVQYYTQESVYVVVRMTLPEKLAPLPDWW